MTVFDDINEERDRQISRGFDAKYDDEHGDGQLAEVAADLCMGNDDDWGIARKWQHDTRRQLVIAAALIVAEIERLDRLSPERGE